MIRLCERCWRKITKFELEYLRPGKTRLRYGDGDCAFLHVPDADETIKAWRRRIDKGER